MLDEQKLHALLDEYAAFFDAQHWKNESYKWRAAQHFQTHWNIEADDFASMLTEAIAEHGNLLGRRGSYEPAGWAIVEMAQHAPEDVRQMFRELFDENTAFPQRVLTFMTRAAELGESVFEDGRAHQRDFAVTTYLWSHSPDDYYIFRSTYTGRLARYLDFELPIKQKSYSNDVRETNFRNYTLLYDLISAEMRKHPVLSETVQTFLTPEYFPDTQMHTLVADLAYCLSSRLIMGSSVLAVPGEELEEIDLLDAGGDHLAATPQKGSGESSHEEMHQPYSRADFLTDVFMLPAQYDRLATLVRSKKNVILQGAPGVGKTFAARRLAWSLMGARDDTRIQFVQFHQNYTYEDFVMGFKPVADGFELRDGIFTTFCSAAERRPDEDFFFIIDEVNRANLSKVFGELLMAIEANHREENITLAYDGRTFHVPKNVFIIAMMNTADRSLALIDYALRRRFSFFEMSPAFYLDAFRSHISPYTSSTLVSLLDKVNALNKAIMDDPTLGKGFCIGHSYFCDPENLSAEGLQNIVDFDLIPLLEEYWFDAPSSCETWSAKLRQALRQAD